MSEVNEWLKCTQSFPYFAYTYARIYNAQQRQWVPFRLWPAQMEVAQAMQRERFLVILKARQIGMSWLATCYTLWLMIFRPASTNLLFSRRDDEAVELLSQRVCGIYRRLPPYMQCRTVVIENEHEFRLTNGSATLAFPSQGGDSYTGNLVLLDEFDLHERPQRLLASVEPTISAGGQLFMMSRPNKARPKSVFKETYRKAAAGETRWRPIFLPWSARPDRDQNWYEEQKRDILASDGSIDRLWEQYPATADEALAPNTMDKRIPAAWLLSCDHANGHGENPLGLPGLQVFESPNGIDYIIGIDPAEGNPQSDESVVQIIRADNGRQVAVLAGRIEPATLATYADLLAQWYSNAIAIVERNNHGHVVIQQLSDTRLRVANGPDGRPGYLKTARTSADLWAKVVEIIRDERPEIHDRETLSQLFAIEGASLKAPDGMHDDRADAWGLAQWGRRRGTAESVIIDAIDPLALDNQEIKW